MTSQTKADSPTLAYLSELANWLYYNAMNTEDQRDVIVLHSALDELVDGIFALEAKQTDKIQEIKSQIARASSEHPRGAKA